MDIDIAKKHLLNKGFLPEDFDEPIFIRVELIRSRSRFTEEEYPNEIFIEDCEAADSIIRWKRNFSKIGIPC
jgi:hypothetical protein